jgi:hypothetical protein
MSKGKWRYPTPALIKRAIEAVQRSGLPVTAIRVSEDAVYVETSTKKEPPSATPTNEWDA